MVAMTAMMVAGLAAASPFATPAGELSRVERAEEAMGSMFGLVLYGPDRAALEAAADAAFEEVHRLDRMLSNYKPGSEWSGVNRDAASRPVVVSSELFELLAQCLEYSRRSEGAFDITIGPLMKLWGFYKGEGTLPRPGEVAGVLERVGYRHVQLDGAARTVRFLRAGLELDPGGIGKGYAVDRMVAVLKRMGVKSALVSAAGSSIYGLGAPPLAAAGWPVSLGAPGEPDRSVGEVRLKNQSLSTSGSYEKAFRAGGYRYSHLIDPRSGYPAQGVASISVVAPRTIDSEAWTKPFFILDPAEAAARVPEGLRVFWCADSPSKPCEWIH